MRTSLDMRPELRGTMTPQLVQSIRLLQLSGLEMQAEAAQWLETNPMLELEDDASEDEELPEFERPQLSVEECWMPSQHGSSGTQYSEDDEDQGRGEAVTPEAESIHLRLLEELPLECKDADQLDIAFTLLDYIDERGYLEESIKVISARSGVRSSDLLEALQLVRRITVPGFAAHDLSECLRLQLETHPNLTRCALSLGWTITISLLA